MTGIDYSLFKFKKDMPSAGRKIIKERQAKTHETKVRKAVNLRDKHRCFFPKCRKIAYDKHHTVYRSKGGKWETDQIVSGCRLHHSWVHNKLIELHGNPDKPPLTVLPTTFGLKAKIVVPSRE